MAESKKKTGDKGEDLAAEYLLHKGYEIIDRNYRWRLGEIDIIACHDQVLCFCEVKRSQYEGESHPELRVNKIKQIRIVRTALKYLTECTLPFNAVRFDILTIKSKHGRNFVEHLENAFWAPDGWEYGEFS